MFVYFLFQILGNRFNDSINSGYCTREFQEVMLNSKPIGSLGSGWSSSRSLSKSVLEDDSCVPPKKNSVSYEDTSNSTDDCYDACLMKASSLLDTARLLSSDSLDQLESDEDEEMVLYDIKSMSLSNDSNDECNGSNRFIKAKQADLKINFERDSSNVFSMEKTIKTLKESKDSNVNNVNKYSGLMFFDPVLGAQAINDTSDSAIASKPAHLTGARPKRKIHNSTIKKNASELFSSIPDVTSHKQFPSLQ